MDIYRNRYLYPMHPRLRSILDTPALGSAITGFEAFDHGSLELKGDVDFNPNLPFRMGHVAEKAVGALIRTSENYRILEESLQVVVEKQTLGELDFILENQRSGERIHLELAYKFYVYDPTLSKESIRNWIGPNRRDSLVEKLEKLKSRQFPLLHHEAVRSRLAPIDVGGIAQKLCFLVSLYLPYGFTEPIEPLPSAVRGYYYDFETFVGLDHPEKRYFIPRKTAWGIDPSTHEGPWYPMDEMKTDLQRCLSERRAPLVWTKRGDEFRECFVVWWGFGSA